MIGYPLNVFKTNQVKETKVNSTISSCELIPLASGEMDLRKIVISHLPLDFLKRHLDHPQAHWPLYPNMTPVGESHYQGRGYLLVTTRCKNNPALAELKLMRE